MTLQTALHLLEHTKDPETYYKIIQFLINDGTAWKLQGSYGRTMMRAISTGYCLLGHKGHRDYYDSYIPSRKEVSPHSKGSFEFVQDVHGELWATRMSKVK